MLLWLQWTFLRLIPWANPRPWFSNILVRITFMDQFHPVKERWVNFCWNGDIKSRGKAENEKMSTNLFYFGDLLLLLRKGPPNLDTQFDPKKILLCSNCGHLLCWGSWVGLIISVLNWNSHLWIKGEYYLLYSFNPQAQNHFLIKEWRETMSGLQGSLTLQLLLLLLLLFWRHGLWDLSCLTRDGTRAPYSGSMKS